MSLADAILQGQLSHVSRLLPYTDLNQIDEYGFTPLIEAAIVENIAITELLLNQGANPNQVDVTGGTPLQWAVENNNKKLSQLLLQHGANPNAYNFSGQPIITMPTLRRQKSLRQLLVRSGANETFGQDYINTKLLGHLFELVGIAAIIDPQNNYVEVDFEGFFLEVTLGLIANSLDQFQNHFAARNLRKYRGLAKFIVEVINNAAELIKYQQYRINLREHEERIHALLARKPLLIPVAYEGHAITFITLDDIWIKCDRREDSRLYDNIMFYRVRNTRALTAQFFKQLLYRKNDGEFINQEIDQILSLEPLTELKVDAQISGNCSWANVEATIPAIFYLMLMRHNAQSASVAQYKTLALNFFQRWREWNKDRALNFCLQSFKESDSIRKACKAEILSAILFQRLDPAKRNDHERIENILSVLVKSPYEYLLKNYLRVYYYESNTPQGRRLFELLNAHGIR